MSRLLVVAVALVACSPSLSPVEFDDPIAFDFDDALTTTLARCGTRSQVDAALDEAITQLGGHRANTATPSNTIRVELDPDCTTGAGHGRPGLIRLCEFIVCANDPPLPNTLRILTKHELGHALGADHVMVRESVMYYVALPGTQSGIYTAEDVAEICKWVTGGVCAK